MVEKKLVYCEVGKGIFNLGYFLASNLFFLNFWKIIFPMLLKLTFFHFQLCLNEFSYLYQEWILHYFFQHTQHMTWLITLNERERVLFPRDWDLLCGSITNFFFRKKLVYIVCLHNLLTSVVYFVLLKSWKLYLQFSK